MVIEYRRYAASWLVTCDRCGKLEHVGTVRDEQKARDIVRRWAWELDTPNGDLCPRCAKIRALRGLDRPPEPDLLQAWPAEFDAREGTFWSKVLSIEAGEYNAGTGQPQCERCGEALSWTVVPDDSGRYLCDDCRGGKAGEC